MANTVHHRTLLHHSSLHFVAYLCYAAIGRDGNQLARTPAGQIGILAHWISFYRPDCTNDQAISVRKQILVQDCNDSLFLCLAYLRHLVLLYPSTFRLIGIRRSAAKLWEKYLLLVPDEYGQALLTLSRHRQFHLLLLLLPA